MRLSGTFSGSQLLNLLKNKTKQSRTETKGGHSSFKKQDECATYCGEKKWMPRKSADLCFTFPRQHLHFIARCPLPAPPTSQSNCWSSGLPDCPVYHYISTTLCQKQYLSGLLNPPEGFLLTPCWNNDIIKQLKKEKKQTVLWSFFFVRLLISSEEDWWDKRGKNPHFQECVSTANIGSNVQVCEGGTGGEGFYF